MALLEYVAFALNRAEEINIVITFLNPDGDTIPTNPISLAQQLGLIDFGPLDPTDPLSIIAPLLIVARNAFRTIAEALNDANNRF
ncbi:MAG: hypothetical protein ACFB02_08055 [Mastigocoleus sp.]